MVDQKTVHHIAKLARLELTEEELQSYSQQLSNMLAHFEQIAEVDTLGIEPLVTPIEIELRLREDNPEKAFLAEEMLANAPEKTGNLFTVPPVV